jgi:glucose-6-phosphate dehydrogenase assembly protein OpcA
MEAAMSASHIIPPSQIQNGLDSLWNSLENKNKMRASLFNLVFYTKKTPRDEYIRKIAHKLIEKFPARIFFISSDTDSSSDYLKTAVAVMSTEQVEYDITCDFIEISVGGKGELQVPFIILPHIIPDLPVFLVWAEDPTLDNPLCSQLQKFATRIIFDSETTENLTRFSQAAAKIRLYSHCEIADLNWARLESWRDLLCDTFSDPDKLEKLKQTSSVTITFNAQETPFFCHTKIQSIYLQAWLATRLKWEFQKIVSDKPSPILQYSFEGRKIDVTIKNERHSSLPPGLILSVELKTQNKDSFLFTRDLKATHQISLEYSTDHECKLPTKFMIAKGESGQSLVKEICHKGTSQHYLEVLQLISKWNESAPC